ncbi:MAG: MFS transporter [Carbonactinosporaceae bacterium]
MPRATTLQAGTPTYRLACATLFGAAFCCFAMIYVAQGILPGLSRDFAVSPAEASLALSLTTLPLAVAVTVVASWAEGRSRRGVLVGTLLGAATLTVLAAASPNFGLLLGLRVLTGLVLAGLPAVSMAYVAEEVDGRALGTVMGLYVSGTGLGGMTGRLLGGAVAGTLSWRWAVLFVGLLGLAGVLMVVRWLPRSRNFVPEGTPLSRRVRGLSLHLRDPTLRGLYVCGFVLMGSLVAMFNYLQYRLAAAPFDLAPAVIASVFLLYLFGTWSSNWFGRLTDRRPRRQVMLLGFVIMTAGVALTLPDSLPAVLAGTALAVFGFFGAHAVASGWVHVATTARRAQASALYLFGYHLGSSLAGFVGGLFYEGLGWPGLVGMIGVLLATGFVVTVRLPAARPPGGSTAGPYDPLGA